jgi:signal transduction histidine kinase
MGMPNRLLLLFCFSFFATFCVAQRDEKETIDVAVNPGDTILINSLIKQAYIFREIRSPEALDYGLRAIRLSRQLNYQKGEGRALGVLAWAYYSQGNFVRALETSYEALKICEQINDKMGIARSINNVGAMAYHQKQYDKAIAYFEQGYSISCEIGDEQTMARSLNNLASMFQLTMPSTDTARVYAQRALVISEKAGDDYYKSICNHTLGDLDFQDGKYEDAIRKYRSALSFSKQLSEALRLEILNQIAEIYLLQNRPGDALTILAKNIATASKGGHRQQLAMSYQLSGKACKQKGNPVLALNYFERYSALHDSLYNEDNSSRLATIQSQADLDRKQTLIELLTKDTLLNKDEMNRQRTELYTAIGGLIGFLFLVGILVYGYQRIERTNVLLRQRTSELARINAAKDKLFSIISHDFRSPLNSLKGILSLVENKHLTREEFALLAEKLRKHFNAVSNDLENLLQWSMTQLQGIQTHSTRIDVQPIVEEHITVFQELAKAKNVQLRSHISDSLFGLADEDHIRLVLRNLINNAIKFTPPGGVVEISGFQDSPFITIQVSDTGVGIGTKQMESLFHRDRSISTPGTNQEKGVGLGLLLCHEFVENNGGRLQVASEPGKGSVFSFTLRAA